MRWLIVAPTENKTEEVLKAESKSYEEAVKVIDSSATITSSHVPKEIDDSPLFRLGVLVTLLADSDAVYLPRKWMMNKECRAVCSVAKLYDKWVYKE